MKQANGTADECAADSRHADLIPLPALPGNAPAQQTARQGRQRGSQQHDDHDEGTPGTAPPVHTGRRIPGNTARVQRPSARVVPTPASQPTPANER